MGTNSGGTPPDCDARAAEAQRFEHLVLGKHRPRSGQAARKGGRRAKPKPRVVLAPGVEQAMQIRERWSHKPGTPETYENQAKEANDGRSGAIRRLHAFGTIDADQKAAAEHIAETAERIMRGVNVRTASLETRVDQTRMGDGTFYEALAAVRLEVAYGHWRSSVNGPIGALLEIIVDDIALRVVAKRHRIGDKRLVKLLIDALDLWPRMWADACKQVDPATLAAAQAAIL